MFRNPPPADFCKWLQSERKSADLRLATDADDIYISGFKHAVLHQNNKGTRVRLSIDGEFSNNSNKLSKIASVLDCSEEAPAELESVSIPVRSDVKFSIKNARIGRISLHHNQGIVSIDNCWIGEFIGIRTQTHMKMTNSCIACLALHNYSFNYLYMKDVWILGVKCPPPAEPGPFTGSVVLQDVFTPRRWTEIVDGSASEVQPWTNVRCHLASMNNFRAASIFHATELSLEREREPSRIARAIGWIYETTSDYANSIARPLGWLGAIWLVLLLAY